MIQRDVRASSIGRPVLFAAAAIVAAVVTAVLAKPITHSPTATGAIQSPPPLSTQGATAGPPWIYGATEARFTLTEYADLECPYCRVYFTTLQRWIDAHPEVNWQWHHLPLSIHNPAATQAARLAECAGEANGNAAFWKTIAWIYQHTRDGGSGLPSDAPLPGLSPAIRTCLDSARPDAVIRAQAEEAARHGITAVPTLRLQDHRSGETVLLHGPVEGDALLSAIDLLLAAPSSHPLSQASR